MILECKPLPYSGEDSCKVLKTGQTTSYHDNDDGDLQRGYAKDYTYMELGG
jgi:hypothetical protein